MGEELPQAEIERRAGLCRVTLTNARSKMSRHSSALILRAASMKSSTFGLAFPARVSPPHQYLCAALFTSSHRICAPCTCSFSSAALSSFASAPSFWKILKVSP